MKTPEEWIEIWKRDGDGNFERSELLVYLRRFIYSVQTNAWCSAVESAAQMCGGDSHIEEGVLSLIDNPKYE